MLAVPNKTFRIILVLAFGVTLSACSAPDPGAEVNDPFEAQNRKIHEMNIAVDRAVVRKAASTYGRVVPDGPKKLINNFSFNFSEPRNAVNSLLQGRIDHALDSSIRFVINTTVGVGGLMDIASEIGIEGQSTDFGQTLYTWGVEEGAYMELPLVGPSTARHTTGRVADLFLNPLSYILPAPESYIGTASSLMWALDTRDEYSVTVDDIFDNSADSYAQARILYLQNRRHALGDVAIEEEFDPFKELGLE